MTLFAYIPIAHVRSTAAAVRRINPFSPLYCNFVASPNDQAENRIPNSFRLSLDRICSRWAVRRALVNDMLRPMQSHRVTNKWLAQQKQIEKTLLCRLFYFLLCVRRVRKKCNWKIRSERFDSFPSTRLACRAVYVWRVDRSNGRGKITMKIKCISEEKHNILTRTHIQQ